jgi:hypothetical protein
MSEAISDLADRMIRDAKVIGLQLESIRLRDPARANLVQQALFAAISGENPLSEVRDRQQLEGGPDDIEGLIVEFLREQGRPQSVAQIHDFIEETGSIDILRPSLTVKLHRMAQHGRVVNVSRGHYALPMHAAGRR